VANTCIITGGAGFIGCAISGELHPSEIIRFEMMSLRVIRLEWKAVSFPSPLNQLSVPYFGAIFIAFLLFTVMQGDELPEVPPYFYTSAKPVAEQSTCPAGWACPAKPLFSSKIGAWYEPWWEARGPHGYQWTSWSRFKPVLGYYASDDPSIIARHFSQLRGDRDRLPYLGRYQSSHWE
jgi:hypothetical protein